MGATASGAIGPSAQRTGGLNKQWPKETDGLKKQVAAVRNDARDAVDIIN